MLALSQASYIFKIEARFGMDNSKRGILHLRHEIHHFKEQVPKTFKEKEHISIRLYALAVS